MNLSIKRVSSDEYNVVPGSGWVIVNDRGKRINWPMLTTQEEARAELAGFHRELRQLASDERSERRGLNALSGGWS